MSLMVNDDILINPKDNIVTQILLIDKDNVKDIDVVLNSINLQTYPIVYTSNTVRDNIYFLLKDKFIKLDRIGIFFENNIKTINKPIFLNNETFFDDDNFNFLVDLIKEFEVKNIDYLGCDTLNSDEWIKYYDKISININIKVGASNDKTGNLNYGGDWIMENTQEDIKNIYFNDNIINYKFLLGNDMTDCFGTANFYSVGLDEKLYVSCSTNNYGELGLGNKNTGANTMLTSGNGISFETGEYIKQIRSSSYCTFVLTTRGKLWACGVGGVNRSGNVNLLGLGSIDGVTQPLTNFKLVQLGTIIPKQIIMNTFWSGIITTQGELYCSGRVYIYDYTTFTKMTLPNGIKAVTGDCGFKYMMIVGDDGNVYGFGENLDGQMGLGDNTNWQNFNKCSFNFNNSGGAESVICGGTNTTYVITKGGFSFGCGNNAARNLGLGNSDGIYKSFEYIGTGLGSGSFVRKYYCGNFVTYAILANGSVYSVGYNKYYLLGNRYTLEDGSENPDENVNKFNGEYIQILIPNNERVIYVSVTSKTAIFYTEMGNLYGLGDGIELGFSNDTIQNNTTRTFITKYAYKPTKLEYLNSTSSPLLQNILALTNVYPYGNKNPRVINLSTYNYTFGPKYTSSDISSTISITPAITNWQYITSNSAITIMVGNKIVTGAKSGTAEMIIYTSETIDYLPSTAKIFIRVEKSDPILVLNNGVSINKTYLDPSFITSTIINTNSTGIKTISLSNTSVATIDRFGYINILSSGTTVLTVTVAEVEQYNSKTASVELIVAKVRSVLTIPNKSINITTSTNQNLNVTTNNTETGLLYSGYSNIIGVNTTGSITINSIGTTTVTVNQPETTNFTAVTDTITVIVSGTVPTIDVSAGTNISKVYKDAAFSLGVTSNSSGAITYLVNNSNVVSVSNTGTVGIVGAGSAIITITQVSYQLFTGVSKTINITVAKKNPTLTITTPTGLRNGMSSVQLLASSDNNETSISYSSNNTSVITFNSTTGVMNIIGTSSNVQLTCSQIETANYNAIAQSISVSVALGIPTLTVQSQYTVQSGSSVTITPTTTSDGTATYTTSNRNICSIFNNVITGLQGGSATITVNYPATAKYQAISSTFTLNVTKIATSITIANSIAKNYGDADFNLNPGTNSNANITYSNQNNSVATVSSNGLVHLVNEGSTIITISQAEDAYNTAASITCTLNVSLNLQPTTISGSGLNRLTFNYGDPQYTITSLISNNTNPFSFASSNSSIVSVNATTGVLTIVSGGSCVINISQQSTLLNQSGSALINVLVNSINPTASLTSTYTKLMTDNQFDLDFTSNSPGAITYSSNNTGVATVNASGQVTIVSSGSATITASQSLTVNYKAISKSTIITINKVPTTISIANTISKYYTDPAFNLSFQTNSTAPITYSSSNLGVASIDSTGKITLVGVVGQTTISVSQPTNNIYAASSIITSTLTVSAILITTNISISGIPNNIIYGDSSFTLTSISNNPEAKTFSSSNTAIATVNSSGQVTIVSAGSTIISVTQPSTPYYSAGSTSVTININKKQSQFQVAQPSDKYMGIDTTLNLSVTNNNNPDPYIFSSNTTGVATVNSFGQVTIASAGTAIITISQPTSTNYLGYSTTVTITIKKQISSINFPGGITSITKTVNDASFNLNVSGTGNGIITYSVTPSNIVNVDTTGQVSIVGGGQATISIVKSATTIYDSSSATYNITVRKNSTTITFPTISNNTINKLINSGNFSLGTQSNSTGVITYTSSNTSIATVSSDGLVSIVGAGTAYISVSQVETSTNLPKTEQVTLVISKLTSTITPITTDIQKLRTDPTFDINNFVSTISDSTKIFTSSNSSAVTINSSGIISIVGLGTSTITITQNENNTYLYCFTTINITVNPIKTVTTINLTNTINNTYNKLTTNNTFSISYQINSNGTPTFTSADISILDVTSQGIVTIKKAGNTTITIQVPETTLYTLGILNVNVNIYKETTNITSTISQISKNINDSDFIIASVITTNNNSIITYASQNQSVATIDTTGKIHITGSGTTTISISQLENNLYTSGLLNINMIVNKLSNSITINNNNSISKLTTDQVFTPSVTSIDFVSPKQYQSTNTNVATYVSGLVTIVGSGTTTLIVSQPESIQYLAAQSTILLTVNIPKIVTAINISNIINSIGTKNISNNTVNIIIENFSTINQYTITLSSNSTETFDYATSDSSIANVTQSGALSILKAGSVTITVSQAENLTYYSGTKFFIINIAKKTNTLTIANPITDFDKIYDDSYISLITQTNSTATKQFMTSDDTIATIDSSGNVTFKGCGVVSLYVSQSETTYYTASTVSETLNIRKNTTIITSLYSSYVKTLNITSFDLGIISNSNQTKTYSSSNNSIATVNSNGIVTLLNVGDVIITVTQLSSNFYTFASKTISLTVQPAKTNTTLSLNNGNALNVYYSQLTVNLPSLTTTNSNAIVTYTSSNLNIATINNGIITIVGLGTCNITTSQLENSGYLAASTSITLNVQQDISIINVTNNYNKTYGDSSFNLNATSNNSNQITYTSSNISVVTVNSSGLVTIIGGGDATITLYQNSTTYFTSITKLVNINISKAITNLSVPASLNNILNIVYSNTPFNLNLQTNNVSGLINYTSSNTSIATVDPTGQVTMKTNGQVTINIAQSDSSTYSTATLSLQLNISVGKILTSIIVPSIINKNMTDVPFILNVSSNSNAAFIYQSSNTNIATITSSGNVSIISEGTVIISVSQVENASYTYGISTCTLNISKVQTILTSSQSSYNITMGNTFSLDSNISGNNPGTKNYLATTSFFTINTTGLITPISEGTSTVEISQASNNTYIGKIISVTINVYKQTSIITPYVTEITKKLGDPSFIISGTSTSPVSITYSISDTTVATVNSNTGVVNLLNGGTAILTLSQVSNTIFTAANEYIYLSVNIPKITNNLRISPVGSVKYGDPSFILQTSSNSSATKLFESSNSSIATINTDGTINIYGAGQVNFTVRQSENTTYTSAIETIAINIDKSNTQLLTQSSINKFVNDPSFNLSVSSNNNETSKIYISSDTNVVTVSNSGTVIIVGVGTATITISQQATNNYNHGSSSVVITISKLNSSLNTLHNIVKEVKDRTYQITTTGNSNGLLTYTSSDTNIATVTSSGLVNLLSNGSINIVISQAETSIYSLSSVTVNLTINKTDTVITVNNGLSYNKTTLDSPFSLNVVTNNSNVVKTYTSSNTSVATIDTNGIVTIGTSSGYTILTVSQISDDLYKSSSQSTTLYVTQYTPKVTNTMSILGSITKYIDDNSFIITSIMNTPGNSTATKTYYIENSSIAIIDQYGLISLHGIGTTYIRVTQPETDTVAAGLVICYITINKRDNTLSLSPITDKYINQGPISLVPINNSLEPITYTVSNTSLATVTSSGVVTLIGSGQVTITASQAANSTYTSKIATVTFNINKIATNLNVNNGNLSINKNTTDNSFQLITSSNNNSTINYSITDNTIASISQTGIITLLKEGNTYIKVYQNDNGVYLYNEVIVTLNVTLQKKVNNLSVPQSTIIKKYGDTSFNLNASSDSTAVKAYSVNPIGIVTVDNNGNVTIQSAGSVSIGISQSENSTYLSGNTNVIVTVNKAIPLITALSSTIIRTYEDSTFNLSASSQNTLVPLVYSCSIPDIILLDQYGNVTIKNAGSTIVTISQAANSNYESASKNIEVTVNKKQPTINVISTINKLLSDSSFNLNAISDNLTSQISYSTSTIGVVNVDINGLISIVGPGTAIITLSQSANSNYLSVIATTTINIDKYTSLISFQSSIINKRLTDSNFTLNATSNSPETFVYSSLSPNVADIDNFGLVTLKTIGTAILVIDQSSNSRYKAATNSVQLNISNIIIKTPTNITVTSLINKLVSDGSFSLNASSNSNAIINYSSNNTNVVTIDSSGYITIVGVGTAIITTSQNETTNFTSGQTTTNINIAKKTTIISIANVPTKLTTDIPFQLQITTNSSSAKIFSGYNNSVLSVDSNGLVTINGEGTTTITLTQNEDNTNLQSSVATTITVYKDQTIISGITSYNKLLTSSSFNLDLQTNNNISTKLYTVNNPAIASVDTSGIVTILGVGQTSITVNQVTNNKYSSGTFTINLNVTSILTTTNIQTTTATYNKTYGDQAFIITGLTSNNPSPFTYQTSTPAILTVDQNNGTVTLLNAGSGSVTISQIATSLYAAGSITVSVNISQGLPNLTATPTSYNKVYGDSPFTITNISSNSSSTKIFSSTDTNVITVDNSGIVTIVGSGQADIIITQNNTTNYTVGTLRIPITINKATTVIRTASSIYNKTTTDSPFTLQITSNSNAQQLFSGYDNTVISVDSSGNVTPIGGGNTLITVSQQTNNKYTYNSILITVNISITKTTTVIVNTPQYNVTYGDSPFQLNTTSNSNAPISYNLSVNNVVQVSATGVVTIIGVGSCSVTIYQATTTTFTACSLTIFITVNKLSQVLTAANSVYNKLTTDPDFNLNITSNTSTAINYNSSNINVTTVDTTGKVHIIGSGTSYITVSQVATSYYNLVNLTITITVTPVQSIITVLPSFTKLTTDAIFSLNPVVTPNSGTLTYTPSISGIVSVSPTGDITILQAGNVVINISQASTPVYLGGSASTTVYVTAALIAPIIRLTTRTYSKFTSSPAFYIGANSSNTSVPLNYTSNDSNIVSVDTSGYVTMTGVGTTSILISQAANATYTSAQETVTITVTKNTATITATSPITKTMGEPDFSSGIQSNSLGSKTYTSSDTSVTTVSSTGIVHLVGSGTAIITMIQDDNLNYYGGTKSITLIINKITSVFSGVPLAIINKTTLSPVFNLGITSNNPQQILYTPSNNNINVDTTGNITIVNEGTTQLTIYQTGNNIYSSISSTVTLVISKVDAQLTTSNNTINVLSTSSPFYIITTSNNSAQKFYNSVYNTIASVDNSGLVTINGSGITRITVSQSATSIYNASSIDIILNVTAVLIPTVINFTNGNLNKLSTDAGFNVYVNTNSNAPKIYASSDSSVAEIDANGFITIKQYGVTNISVTQNATSVYSQGTSSFTLNIDRTTTIINVANTLTKELIQSPFNINALSNSNAPFVYSSSNNSIATVDVNGSISLISSGNVTIIISQVQNNKYTASTTSTYIVINSPKITTVITANPSYISKTTQDIPFNIPFTTNSNAQITYSTTSAIINLNTSGQVTITGPGTAVVTISQSDNGFYTSESETVTINITAILTTTVITVPNILITKTTQDSQFNVSATSNSSAIMTYSSSNPLVATVGGTGTITILGAGTTYISISQQQNLYNTSANATVTLIVSKQPANIIVSSPFNKFTNSSSFDLSATSNSNAPISYTVSPNSTSIVSVTNLGVVTILSSGVAYILLSQLENQNYYSTNVTAIIYVSIPQIQTIITLPTSFIKTTTDAQFSLNPSSNNNLSPFVYTIQTGTSVSVDSSGLVTINSSGQTIITVSQAANAQFLAGTFTTNIYINITSTIITTNTPSYNIPYGTMPFGISSTISSNSNITKTYTSSNTNFITVDTAGLVTIVGVGNAIISVTQNSNSIYGPSLLTIPVSVTPIQTVITVINQDITKNISDQSFTLNPRSNSPLAFNFSIANLTVATINASGQISIVGAGNTTITIFQNANNNYSSGFLNINLTVTSNSIITQITTTLQNPLIKLNTDTAFSLPANLSSNNAISSYAYSSTNNSVVSVSTDGLVTIIGIGTANIIVMQAASGLYLAGSLFIPITVNQAPSNLTVITIPQNTISLTTNSVPTLIGATSNNANQIFYFPSPGGIITIDSNGLISIVSGTAGGQVTVTLFQDPTPTLQFGRATLTVNVTVVTVTTVLTWSQSSITKTATDTPFTVTTTSNSSQPKTYASLNTLIATVDQYTGLITPVGEGTTTITVNQAASTNYTAASEPLTITITKSIGTLNIPSIISKYINDTAFNINVTTNSDGIINYNISPAIATINASGVITLASVGSAVIIVNLPATSKFTGLLQTIPLTILKVTTVLSSKASISINVKATTSVSATSNNNLSTITYRSSNTKVATITTTGVVKGIAKGTATITITQTANNIFTAASKSIKVTVK